MFDQGFGLILSTIQNEETSRAAALFCKLPTNEEKKKVILDINVTPKIADELVSADCQNNFDVLENVDVQVKLKGNCDQVCQYHQNEAIKMVELAQEKTEEYFKEKENVYLKNIQYLDVGSEVLKELGSSIGNIGKALLTPEKTKTRLLAKIESSQIKGYLTKDQEKQMSDQVRAATDFDPVVMASTQDVTNNALQELRIKRNQYFSKMNKNKGLWKQAVNYWNQTKIGFTSLSDSAKLEKGLNAVSGVLSAIGKFTSNDPLQYVSGALDLVNEISVFLPPPASMVTSAISGIFSIFGLGGSDPSNQDVINSIQNGFKEQKSFISEEFVKQNEFIKTQFAEQNKFISNMLVEHNKFILQVHFMSFFFNLF